jgi:pimeloyl-ACP methyl ester carboxylesterase
MAMFLTRSTFIFSLALVLAISADAQETGKPPVIIIPGVTGSQLVNPQTGRTVWFSVKRDKEDDLRLPITSTTLSANRDSLRPTDIIRKVELPVLPDVEVYQSLIDALIAKGYTEATWDKPKATDVFYVFAYDWRRDNVESARLLTEKMATAKRTLKNPSLKFDILAHSMGGLIARYAAMYGGAEPPRTPNPKPTWAGAPHIRKLMMFGTPNEGSASSFDALINGYPIIADKKLPFIDDLRAEDVMTNPSSFQLLPHQSAARFLDEDFRPLKIDIYDVNTWIKYGWGALADPKFLSKLKDAERLAATNKEIKPKQPDKDTNPGDIEFSRTTFAQAKAYFAAGLRRAKLFHAALNADSRTMPIEVFAYGGNCVDTLDAIILIQDKSGKWETVIDARDFKTATGKTVRKEQVKGAIFTIGDGRVTQRSLLAESSIDGQPEFPKIGFASTSFGCGTHTKLFLDKPIQDSFLSALVVEKTAQP